MPSLVSIDHYCYTDGALNLVDVPHFPILLGFINFHLFFLLSLYSSLVNFHVCVTIVIVLYGCGIPIIQVIVLFFTLACNAVF